MWTPTSQWQHSRDHLRYGSDLSDAERNPSQASLAIKASASRINFRKARRSSIASAV